jgi:hypothetical protein
MPSSGSRVRLYSPAAVLDDRAKRRELSNLGVEEATESPLFARIAELGKEFETGC